MHEHVVDDVLRHRPQPARQPDRAVGRGAGTPPAVLVVDPADGGRLGQPSRCASDSARARAMRSSSPPSDLRRALLAGLQLGDHLGHPAPLLGGAEGGRDEHDRAAASRGRRSPSGGGGRCAGPRPRSPGRGGRRRRARGRRPRARRARTGGRRERRPARGRVRGGSRSGHAGTVSHRAAPRARREAPDRVQVARTVDSGPAPSPVARAPSTARGRRVPAGRSAVRGPPGRAVPAAVPGPRTGTRRRGPHVLHRSVHRLWVPAGPDRPPPRRGTTSRVSAPTRVACLRNGARRACRGTPENEEIPWPRATPASTA